MPIQIIIFLTKTKLFACEINSTGKAESISIKGNTEIKCEGKKSADELIACLFDAFNIDDFADENFDIVIIESDTDREVIKHLETKCSGASKLNIISMEKILPVIASGKNIIKSGEDVTVLFADEVYRITCNENNIVTICKTRKIEEAVALQENDFAFLYRFVSNAAVFVDKSKLEEANSKVLALQNKVKSYEEELTQLREVQKQFIALQENQKQQIEDQKRQNTEAQQFCTNCGEELKPGSNFCENCGTNIFNNNVPAQASITSKSEALMQIVEKHKNIFDTTPDYHGEFYIHGAIPQSKLNNVMQKFSFVCKTAEDYKKILALYCSPNKIITSSYLLFTEDGLFYHPDINGNCGLIYWNNMKSFTTHSLNSMGTFGNAVSRLQIHLINGDCVEIELDGSTSLPSTDPGPMGPMGAFIGLGLANLANGFDVVNNQKNNGNDKTIVFLMRLVLELFVVGKSR